MQSTKPKKCKECGELFTPFNSMTKACSVECAAKIGKKVVQKRAVKAFSQRKREFWLNDKGLRTKEAQKAFNAFIRERDKGHACISCKRSTGAKVNAGHYKSVGSSPALRFDELNCHLQCEHCNCFKSGAIELYRPNLIDKIGLDKVEWLEGPHDHKKYACEELLAIEQKYKLKLKELRLISDD